MIYNSLDFFGTPLSHRRGERQIDKDNRLPVGRCRAFGPFEHAALSTAFR
jgi:hypothetical protein